MLALFAAKRGLTQNVLFSQACSVQEQPSNNGSTTRSQTHRVCATPTRHSSASVYNVVYRSCVSAQLARCCYRCSCGARREICGALRDRAARRVNKPMYASYAQRSCGAPPGGTHLRSGNRIKTFKIIWIFASRAASGDTHAHTHTRTYATYANTRMHLLRA